MANPTNPFNWQMPQSTDLVTDLPADFETFGQAVATSMADLLGGTTGQVLSKASNTDMDFTWVAQDDSNAIQNAIVDAKGDLIAASAADTPARLAVGANGETLVADSSTSTGLRYQVPVNANPVLNSAMQCWQRGTSFSYNASVGYSADRWYVYSVPASTISRQVTGDTTNLPFIQYCIRVQRNSGGTNTNGIEISNSFETVNSLPYAGKTVTLSFYARAGANYSTASNALGYVLATGTGTDQRYANDAGYTGLATPILGTATLTTTWQRFTATTTLSSSMTEMAIKFYSSPTGTAGANDYYEVTGVQVEVGSVATPFKTYAGTIQGELAACQRYYVRSGGQAAYQNFGQGYASGTTTATVYVQYPVTMRTAPSALEFSTLALYDGASILSASALSLNGAGTNGAGVDMTVSGATQYRPYRLFTNNSTSGYLAFTAEL